MKLGRILGVLALLLVMASPALAETNDAGTINRGLIGLAAALGLGIAAFGAALGQGRATAAAMESIGRNPNSADRLFTPLLLGLALMEALKSTAFYVGAIGSQKNQAKRKERLLEFGVTAEQLERLHGPVGLKNGARTPPEIAVAILAEITATKYGYRIPSPVAVGVEQQNEIGCAN